MLASSFWLKGIVGGRGPISDGAETTARFGRSNDLMVSALKGKYAEQCVRGNVFFASAAAVTVPVIDVDLVSVFTLYNPPNSGVNMELIDFLAQNVVADTVVNGIGLYSSNPTLTAVGTFTTLGVPQSGLLGGGAAPSGQFYSAYTHSGTPILERILGGWSAVTNPNADSVNYQFDGSLVLAPGVAASVAMTTAAGEADGITLGMSWAEHPV